MRSSFSPLHQLVRAGELDTLDELAAAGLHARQAESAVRGVGHVLVSVDVAGVQAYTAVVTTEAGTATIGFDPESEAARLLHSVGVTKICADKPVSKFIPADIAAKLIGLADGTAA